MPRPKRAPFLLRVIRTTFVLLLLIVGGVFVFGVVGGALEHARNSQQEQAAEKSPP
ncbi:MAG: hypothetical protein ACOY3P_07085 [Planctomycetota bacterium]